MDEVHQDIGLATSVYEIGGRRHEATAPGFAETLAAAHARQCRPRCMCCPARPEMYVARLAGSTGGFVVKRMPETGNQHAFNCLSFSPAADISGLGPLLGTAIQEDPTTGLTTLRLDFPLSRAPGRSTSPHLPNTPGSAFPRPRRLSLRGLLHYLWEQAELTRWHPGFAGKRTWATVRRHLLDAANQAVAAGSPLGARLYVPEPFSLEAQDEIRARRWAKWSATAPMTGRHQKFALLVAEVKEIVPFRHGYRAVIKHVPDVAFALTETLYRAIGRRFGQELNVWSASADIRLVVIATFELCPAGVPAISSLYPMPVTRQWVPVDTLPEQQLVERLVQGGHAFTKLLRYDICRSEKRACVALTDRGTPGTLLFA